MPSTITIRRRGGALINVGAAVLGDINQLPGNVQVTVMIYPYLGDYEYPHH